MNKVCRVLIVDDSTLYRSQIRGALEGIEGIEVVGFASNGRLACEVLKTKEVDLITLDLEMPEMDGLAALAEFKKMGITARVIVLSAQSKQGASSALEALRLGASDFLAKPKMGEAGGLPSDIIRAQLVPKIRQFHAIKEQTLAKPSVQAKSSWQRTNLSYFRPQVLVIASSTGGPNALEQIFSRLNGPLGCPVLIAQHMPALFTAMLAERLARVSGLQVREAVDGERLGNDTVYICPGDYHLRIAIKDGEKILKLTQDEKRNSVRPCADFLFESAVEVFKSGCLGMVLTGMGADGKDGAIAIKSNGGGVLIQDEKSCVVFGMPGAVFQERAFDFEGDLQSLSSQLINLGVFRQKSKGEAA